MPTSLRIYLMGLVAFVWNRSRKDLKILLPASNHSGGRSEHLAMVVFPCPATGECKPSYGKEIAKHIGLPDNVDEDGFLFFEEQRFGSLILAGHTLSLSGAAAGTVALAQPGTVSTWPVAMPKNGAEARGVAWIPEMRRLGVSSYGDTGHLSAKMTLVGVQAELSSFRLATACASDLPDDMRVFSFTFKEVGTTRVFALRQAVTDVAVLTVILGDSASFTASASGTTVPIPLARDAGAVEVLLGNLTKVVEKDLCGELAKPGIHFAHYYDLATAETAKRYVPHKGMFSTPESKLNDATVPTILKVVSFPVGAIGGALNRPICTTAMFSSG